MSNQFERPLPKFRLAEIHFGDDLQAIAEREMGDANRWNELVFINSLQWPYVTSDPSLAGPSVLLAGALIRVPAPTSVYVPSNDAERVYGRDCVLQGRQLTDNGAGDFAIVSGVDNLSQQLRHRVDTPKGQARRHPDYGCSVWRLRGRVNGPTAGALGASYVKAALLSDYRVKKVDGASAQVGGDSVRISARALAIDGSLLDVVTQQ